MAESTLKYRVVTRVRVACGAYAPRVPMRHREPRVIESSSRPLSRGVAGLACRGESCRHMVGIRRRLVNRSVAAVAIGRNTRVVIVDVATRASHRRVRSGQRKSRRVVVEGGAVPVDRVVAQLAGSGKTELNMVDRRGRRVVVGLMTGHAGRARQTEIVVHVARTAGNARVRACQRPTGGGMIECCAAPVRRGVAYSAIGRESCCRVTRVRRPLIVRLMARYARAAGQCVIIVHVARRAGCADVSTREGETRAGMIEYSPAPRCG